MQLDGAVELEGVSRDDAWVVFSDPEAIRDAIPGCKLLSPVRADGGADPVGAGGGVPRDEGERLTFQENDEYTALIKAGTRSIKPTFESEITITEREFPRMSARIDGAGGDSAFTMETAVEFVETADGVTIDWRSDFDVAGRLGGIDGSILSLFSEKMVEHFFDRIEQNVAEAGT